MQRGESSQDRIYLQLRAAMMRLTLAPGEPLHTQELAARLGVSRTPVREAFIRLQRDGLVNILPQRETTVSLIDLSRVLQGRILREGLEREGLELEERPLRLHLAAWADCSLEVGGYEGDVTEKLLSFLRRDLPEKVLDKRMPPPVNVDIDELNGELEP